MSVQRRILLTEENGRWTAEDKETGVASQGETRTAALAHLDNALELYQDEDAGRAPTEEELRAVGINPDENQSGELPEILR